MKKILIVRHAKSSWTDPRLSDHDRPLDERGHKDAKQMGKYLFDQGIAIDAFISSTASRAFTTASYFTSAYGKETQTIQKVTDLYHPSIQDIFEAIHQAGEDYENIAIFCHNMGVTEFANYVGDFRIDEVSTCGVLMYSSDQNNWSEVSAANMKLLHYFTPKKDLNI
jgi:phosphohistidine phosphatase